MNIVLSWRQFLLTLVPSHCLALSLSVRLAVFFVCVAILYSTVFPLRIINAVLSFQIDCRLNWRESLILLYYQVCKNLKIIPVFYPVKLVFRSRFTFTTFINQDDFSLSSKPDISFFDWAFMALENRWKKNKKYMSMCAIFFFTLFFVWLKNILFMLPFWFYINISLGRRCLLWKHGRSPRS